MESFEVKQTFDRKQEASWEPEKFGLGPADTADLSKQYNTICLPLVEPEHFIEVLQMTASKAEDIEVLRAKLGRRMAELCVEFEDMRLGLFEVAAKDTQLSDDDCTHIGKAFAGNSVALGSILKAVIKLPRYELRPESPFLCKFSKAKDVL